MINILIPVVENPKEFSQFVETKKGKDYKIFVGIKDELSAQFKPKNKNVEIIKFSNNSKKEEIINSLHSCKLSHGRVLILRRIPTEEEFASLEKSHSDIVSVREKKGKVATFFKRILAKIVRKVFAFNYFEDISAICYSENMFQLLSVCQNLSMASRINKYVGVDIEEIETISKSVRKDYCRWKTILLFSLATLLLLSGIAGAVCLFVFVPPRVLNIVLIVFGLALVLVIWSMALFNFLRTVAVGSLHYGRAEEV